MSEHPGLTARQCEVLVAVVETGSIKGSARQLGISESGVKARVAYACERCGCGSVLELVYHHHREIEGVYRATTASVPAAG
jgi:DNA-binding NarL/FixJ family response regulator